ncbi:MAG: glycosyltransferase family 2 protein [Thermodesulfobacteriota bacterium]
MKLVIQIPCYNEEKTLPEVIHDLPRELPGVDEIEILVIDDGSTDGTVGTAGRAGAHHIASMGSNLGCGAAFQFGLRKCLELGADVIVNTDGDNQYRGECVRLLIGPILAGKADMVIGTRPIDDMPDFSRLKKRLQRLGSLVARQFSGIDVPDATSGFRAFTADAAMRLHLAGRYSHTLETIIQAGQMNMRISHVPVEVNPKRRESRLMASTWQYVRRSAAIILRSYVRYRPLRTFFYLSFLPGLLGFAICLRFLYYFFVEQHSGHIQSLILAAILILIAFHLLALGVLADLTSANRSLLEEVLYILRRESRSGTRRGREEQSDRGQGNS